VKAWVFLRVTQSGSFTYSKWWHLVNETNLMHNILSTFLQLYL